MKKERKPRQQQVTLPVLTRTDQQKIWDVAERIGFSDERVEFICQKRFRLPVMHITSSSVAQFIRVIETIAAEERAAAEKAREEALLALERKAEENRRAAEAKQAAEEAAIREKERRVGADREKVRALRQEWAASHKPSKKLRRKKAQRAQPYP